MDLNTSVLFLTSHIIHALNLFIPKKSCYKSSYSVWYSNELKALVRKKKCAHKCFKKSSNYNDYLLFTYYRKKCKALSISCYERYVRTIELNMSINIKAFWNFVNAKRSTKGIPNCLHLNEIKANNDTDGANLFAEFFQSVFSTSCTVASNHYDVHDTPLHLSVDISDVLLSWTPLIATRVRETTLFHQ